MTTITLYKFFKILTIAVTYSSFQKNCIIRIEVKIPGFINYFFLIMLSEIIPLIQKVTERENLTVAETEKAFSILTKEDVEAYYFLVFLAALHAKGETADELLGYIHRTEKLVPPHNIKLDGDVIEIAGTGGDKLKTLNVSTAAAFILASLGIYVPKQSFFAVTGVTGSGDLLGAFGVDIMKISLSGIDKITELLRKTKVATFVVNFMANPEEIKGVLTWAKKRQELDLNFITIFHLAANVYNPFPMRRRIYGVFDPKYLRVLAELFQKLNYERGLVFYGGGGLDEVSNIGETQFIEFSQSGLKAYKLSPDDFGVRVAKPEEIRATSKEKNIQDFLRVIYGKERGPKCDLVAINASVALYALGRIKSWRKGAELAKKQLESGEVARTFENYIRVAGKPNLLQKYLAIL